MTEHTSNANELNQSQPLPPFDRNGFQEYLDYAAHQTAMDPSLQPADRTLRRTVIGSLLAALEAEGDDAPMSPDELVVRQMERVQKAGSSLGSAGSAQEQILAGLYRDMHDPVVREEIEEWRTAQASPIPSAPPYEVPVQPMPEMRKASMTEDEIEAAKRLIDGVYPGNQSSGTRERNHHPLVAEVVQAARGTAVINTDLRPGMQVNYGRLVTAETRQTGTETVSGPGYRTFGDGVDGNRTDVLPVHFHRPVGSQNPIYDSSGNMVQGMVEAVSFPPAAEGYRYFDYTYHPGLTGAPQTVEEQLGLPTWREANGTRVGNYLITRITLPEAVADRLQAAIEAEPDPMGRLGLVRQVVAEIAQQLGGLSPQDWEAIRPPYSQPNSNRQLFEVDPGVGPYGEPALSARPL